jgi:competence protein ComEA
MAAAACAVADDDVQLPEGKGKDAVEAACLPCHTAERIAKQKLTLDQWRGTLREMIENGASLNPDQWEPVVAYLAKNFGPDKPDSAKINVNTVSAKEMSAALRLTLAEADAIVAYRAANGYFKDVNDLRKVPGLDEKKIDAQKDRIGF